MAVHPRFVAAVACLAVISAALGCSSSSDASTASQIEGLPLPAAAHEIHVSGDVVPEHAERRLYVVKGETSLADVRGFYLRELPVGEHFRDWAWCGSRAESTTLSRAWRRGTRVLTLEFFRQTDSTLEIPAGWVVVIVAENPRSAARDGRPACNPAA